MGKGASGICGVCALKGHGCVYPGDLRCPENRRDLERATRLSQGLDWHLQRLVRHIGRAGRSAARLHQRIPFKLVEREGEQGSERP